MEKAQARDKLTCRFCGFHADHYQRVVPYADSGDNIPFVTACTFCEQCILLERAGLMGSGILVWLPEIGQAELNHMARAIYVARAADSEMAAVAARALDVLMARRSDAKKRLGSDDPLMLTTIMHENLTEDECKVAARKLDGIRVLPLDKLMVRGPKGDVNQFPRMVQYWLSPEGPFAKLPVDKWADMFKAATAAAGHA
jgi:intracellular multiplication protein IcmJ